jgi:Protein of unknown function (DUF1203)
MDTAGHAEHMTHDMTFEGLDYDEYLAALASGVDQAGNTIEPYVDTEGGWPLRCCLHDSQPGDQVALIAWSPFRWNGAYRETGPVFVHAAGCTGPWTGATLPADFEQRPMTLRPYNHEHRMMYNLVNHVPQGRGLTALVDELLANPDVAEVYGRNATGGCFAFVARRAA